MTLEEAKLVDIHTATLPTLKEVAKAFNIDFSPNIGLETLKDKIITNINPDLIRNSKDNVFNDPNEELRRENLKLIRVRINSNCPDDVHLQMGFCAVSNSILGTIKQYFPIHMGAGEYFHIPNIIYKNISEYVYTAKEVTTKRGSPSSRVITKILPRYTIEVGTPLTPAQLDELRKLQLSRGDSQTDESESNFLDNNAL